MKRAGLILLLGLFLSSAGCTGNRQFGTPTLDPVPPDVQRQRAVRFDPYPDPSIGPSTPGVRPKCYETPSPERCTGPKYQRL